MHWLVGGLVMAGAVLSAGALYQHLGGLSDRRRLLGQGRHIKIAGGRLYLRECGSNGPTIVFEAGIGATSQNWYGLQQQLAGMARTVTYDRGGLGWSIGGRCTERTPSNVARELHELLWAAQIPSPYLLVGHSFGGLVMRRFALEYPEEVSGMVLVDPMRPEAWPPINEAARGQLSRNLQAMRLAGLLARIGIARWIATSLLCRSGRAARAVARSTGNGGARVLGRLTAGLDKMPRETWPAVAAHWSNPHFYRGMVAHLQAVPATVREMQDAASIENVPVTVFTPNSSEALSDEALRRIGSNVQQIIAYRSGHWIHLDEPDLVLNAVHRMIDSDRPQTRGLVPEVVAEPT